MLYLTNVFSIRFRFSRKNDTIELKIKDCIKELYKDVLFAHVRTPQKDTRALVRLWKGGRNVSENIKRMQESAVSSFYVPAAISLIRRVIESVNNLFSLSHQSPDNSKKRKRNSTSTSSNKLY